MRRVSWPAIAISAVFLLTVSAPFISAYSAADSQHVFGGFLLNPIDGNSYLAKMRQGYEGAWTFTLPYAAEPGTGAAINLYYLFLGHAARWLSWGLAFTFHAARPLGATALCAALWRLLARSLPPGQQTWAFALALFGSGLGWLAVAFGGFTSDFWVAEAYPFLAAFANAHFPLGLALQIYLLTPLRADEKPSSLAPAALLLAVVYPFGWAVALAALLAHAAFARGLRGDAKPSLIQAAWVLAGGLPAAAYSLWVVNAHPVLAQWNAQNLTPAPPLWDFVVSFSTALVIAVLGAAALVRERRKEAYVLLAWAAVGITLVYLPLGLQRRFVSGLYVPLAALAVLGLAQWFHQPGRLRIATAGLLLVSVLTNVLILLGAAQAARAQEPALYLSADETAAYAWLDEHATPGALVLAPPQYGLRLPAYADVRVWYGHPFETIEADERRAEVEAFFDERIDQGQFLAENQFDYVLANEAGLTIPGWDVLLEQGDFVVLAPE
jgi:hypothetical protein